MMRLLTVLLALWLSACSSIPTHQPISPDISLADIDLDKLTLDSARFVLTIRIKNPNQFDLPLQALQFATSIDGKKFATGNSKMRTTIPANGEGLYKIRIDTKLSSMLKQARDTLLNKDRKVKYDIRGHVSIANWPVPIPFDRSGDLSR